MIALISIIAIVVLVVITIKSINAKRDRYIQDIKLIEDTVDTVALHHEIPDTEIPGLKEKAISHYIIEKTFNEIPKKPKANYVSN